LDLLLPKVSGPDVLRALKLATATAAIPVVVMRGRSQKNPARLEKHGAFAFPGKAELALDQGPEPLLLKLESINKGLTASAGRKQPAQPAPVQKSEPSVSCLHHSSCVGIHAMNRRDFIRASAAVSAAAFCHPRTIAQNNEMSSVRLTVRADRLGNKIGDDFTGLSYESAQLGNPHFFSGDHAELAGFLRRLGTSGVLRIGGNTSEYCYWTPDPAKPANLPTAESMRTGDKANPIAFGLAVGPDTGHKAPAPVNITPLAIRNLREFLDASGWKLIYGLNMGTGTAEDAADEAAYVMDVTGPKLIAFQLCNEPDLFYRNGIRKADYDFKQFAGEWQRFYQTIRARVPSAPFAGPDTAYNNDWLVPFAKQFKNEAVFLSQHYYAEGPPTDPAMTIERLLRPNPKLEAEFEGMKKTMHESGLPFRLAETNSCYQGGKQGVSDTFASALWSADLMFQLASAGGLGINFHGGGYGWYTPIAGTREHGLLARPVYYGMLLFAQAGAGQLVESKIDQPEQAPLLTAYGVRSNTGVLNVAAFNKNLDRGVRLTIDAGQRAPRVSLLRLHAPRVDDTTDITFGGSSVGSGGAWSVARQEIPRAENGAVVLELPAASAVLVTFERE
jgi:CheY-like chemotaxis protein